MTQITWFKSANPEIQEKNWIFVKFFWNQNNVVTLSYIDIARLYILNYYFYVEVYIPP